LCFLHHLDNVNKLYLSGSYRKDFNQHFFYVGTQLGFVNKRFSYDDVSFPEQFNRENGEFDADMPRAEVLINESLSYLDFNLGMLWNRQYTKLKPEVGLAIFHLSKPRESFFKEDIRLHTRQVLTAKVKWDIGNKFYLYPNLLFMGQGRATDFVMGSNVGYKLAYNKLRAESIYLGSYVRNGIERNK